MNGLLYLLDQLGAALQQSHQVVAAQQAEIVSLRQQLATQAQQQPPTPEPT